MVYYKCNDNDDYSRCHFVLERRNMMTKAQVIKHIKELERSYCDDVSKHGPQGWLKYLADDVVFTTSGHHPDVRGKDTVRKRLEGLYKADYVLYHWDVEHVDVSDDFTLAYSYSTYTYKIRNSGEQHVYIGKDCNIWKKIDGKYKVIMQIGNRIETEFDSNKRRIGKANAIRPYQTKH